MVFGGSVTFLTCGNWSFQRQTVAKHHLYQITSVVYLDFYDENDVRTFAKKVSNNWRFFLHTGCFSRVTHRYFLPSHNAKGAYK